MESTFILKQEDLNVDFIENIKKLFSGSRQLQITISSSEDFGLFDHETSAEYFDRLSKAAEDVSNQKNIIEISDSE